jgi:hypothetical protein
MEIGPGWQTGGMMRFPSAQTAALVPIAAHLQALHSREYAPAELPKEAAISLTRHAVFILYINLRSPRSEP